MLFLLYDVVAEILIGSKAASFPVNYRLVEVGARAGDGHHVREPYVLGQWPKKLNKERVRNMD